MPRPTRTSWILAALWLSAGCRQQLVVYECDDGGHAATDGGAAAADAELADAGDAGTPDSGAEDSGPIDAGAPDSGACVPFCLTSVQASHAVANVREVVTLTPVVDAAAGVAWSAAVVVDQIQGLRAPGRPALGISDAPIDVTSTGATLTFRVLDVAPWVLETRFVVPVTVRDTASGFSATQTVEILVRGNVVLSTGTDGRVVAVASDGRPASLMGQYPDGVLLDLLVSTPRGLRMLDDGTLLVYDEGATPPRISRFELTGKDVGLPELQYQDQGVSLFTNEQNPAFGFAALPDGRLVYPEYHFSGPSGEPKSRLMFWNADRTFDRSVWAPGPMEEWRSSAPTPDGKVIVVDRGPDVISRFDPATGLADGTFVDQLPGTPYSVHATARAAYVTGYEYILEVPWGGGRAAISGLPGSSTIWRGITAIEGGRLLAIRDSQTSSGNVAIIEDRQFVAFFRAQGVGPVISPWGIEYLK